MDNTVLYLAATTASIAFVMGFGMTNFRMVEMMGMGFDGIEKLQERFSKAQLNNAEWAPLFVTLMLGIHFQCQAAGSELRTASLVGAWGVVICSILYILGVVYFHGGHRHGHGYAWKGPARAHS